MTVAAKETAVLKIGSASETFGPSLSAEDRKACDGKFFIIPAASSKAKDDVLTPGSALVYTGTVAIHSYDHDLIASDVPVFRINGTPGRYILSIE